MDDDDGLTWVVGPFCGVCGDRGIVLMPTKAYELYESGELIQRAWPEASPATREMLMTGTHPACWEKMMAVGE